MLDATISFNHIKLYVQTQKVKINLKLSLDSDEIDHSRPKLY